MILDGVYLHHLVKEIKEDLINKRINKLALVDKSTFLFFLQGKRTLYLSLNPDICHLRLTNLDFVTTSKQTPLFQTLKKHLQASLIKDIKQIDNERIVTIEIEAADDLGYKYSLSLIIEFFGRNANLFLTDENNLIIDCYRKSFVLEDNNKRILIPKTKYQQPLDEKINPFATNEILKSNNYQGLSNLAYTEVIYKNDLGIIKQKPKPQIIKRNNKVFFSAFDLEHLGGTKTIYASLSQTLEEYYTNQAKLNILNYEQKLIENYLKREKRKVINKLEKQKREKQKAFQNLNLEQIGNLLSANLHRIKKYDQSIIVENFYNNNEDITINLDPRLSGPQNLENIFKRYKKAKRATTLIEQQIIASETELKYLGTLTNQLELANQHELREIIEELNLIPTTKKKKILKPQIKSYSDPNDNKIWVGKNNLQNNYLTNQFAKKTDYFFHVRGVPGSHTILRTTNLTEEIITLAAQIASLYSKSKNSSNVPVDYTLVRNVKRIPKQKGSFVTYTNYKTVFVTPSLEFIQENLTEH